VGNASNPGPHGRALERPYYDACALFTVTGHYRGLLTKPDYQHEPGTSP